MVYKGIFISIQPCGESQKLGVILRNNVFPLPKTLKVVSKYNHSIRIIEYYSSGFYELLERGVRHGYYCGSVYCHNGVYFRHPLVYRGSPKERGGKNNFYLIIFELGRVNNETQDKLGPEFIIFISVTSELFKEINF